MKRLGLITIGQSPRTDLTPDIQPLLEGIEIIERGALDDLSNEEIAALELAPGDEVLTSRLRDGTSAVFGQGHVIGPMQAAITELENDVDRPVDAVLLACAGEFPTLKHKTPLLRPDRLMRAMLSALSEDAETVGLICPLPEQLSFIINSVGALNAEVIAEAATPYSGRNEQVVVAAQRLAERGAKMLVGFCVGYTEEMREEIRRATGLPVLLVRSVAARVASEILQPVT